MTFEQNSRVCTNKHNVMHILQEELNIFQGLSPVEFAEVRALVIDMVLATDMSAHFEHVKQMRLLLSAPDRYTHIIIQCLKCTKHSSCEHTRVMITNTQEKLPNQK